MTEVKIAFDAPDFLVQLAGFKDEFKCICFERKQGLVFVILDTKIPDGGACAIWLECLGFSKVKTDPADNDRLIYKAEIAA